MDDPQTALDLAPTGRVQEAPPPIISHDLAVAAWGASYMYEV